MVKVELKQNQRHLFVELSQRHLMKELMLMRVFQMLMKRLVDQTENLMMKCWSCQTMTMMLELLELNYRI